MIGYSGQGGMTDAKRSAASPLYLTTAQVARRLGISVRTLERMRADGLGPTYTQVSAQCLRYPLPQLEVWESSRTVTPATSIVESRAAGRNVGGTA